MDKEWTTQQTAHVSRVMREAGFRKAGRYSSFHQDPGYIVQSRKDFVGPMVKRFGRMRPDYVPCGATVMFHGEFHHSAVNPEIVVRAAEAIRAAGYTAKITSRGQHIEVTA